MSLCISVLFAVVSLSNAQWDTVAPLPSPRYSGAAVGGCDSIYYIGGSAAGGIKTSTLFIYSVVDWTWSVAAPMAVARHRFGAALLNGRIYVFGGWGDGGILLNSAECYDIAADTWLPIETLSTRRGSLVGAAADGKVYAIGGKDASGNALSLVEEYDPQAGHWRPRAPMPTPRCEMAAGSVSEYVVVIGGTNGSGSELYRTTELYDAATDFWSPLADMPTARAGAGCAFFGPNFLVFGGIGPGFLNSHADEWYYLPADNWESWEMLPSSRRYIGGAASWPNHFAYAIGGLDSMLQPTALVERLELPLGVQEETPGPAYQPKTGFVRPGEPLSVPLHGSFRAVFFSPDGRLAARCSGTDFLNCPALAPGLYLVQWSAPGRARAITRLLVLSN